MTQTLKLPPRILADIVLFLQQRGHQVDAVTLKAAIDAACAKESSRNHVG